MKEFNIFKRLSAKICDAWLYCMMIFYCVFRYPKSAQEIIQAYDKSFKDMMQALENGKVSNE